MEPTNEMMRKNGLVRRKGCMHLAPGGELIMALASVVGWLIFLFEFAIV